MSLNNFISYLQQILSMIDPNDPYSVALGKTALSATIRLAEVSEKAGPQTIRAMRIAENQFQYLAENAKDFAGKPGHYEENERRRHRLLMTVSPSC